ncbi:MAG: helix-turn-helix transcriptional regulator [Massiliimalia sp.]|jgi:predicted DNA-binding transcriptional regulator YafY
MKIDRLIGILCVLLQQDRVTAPQLSEKFEVSRRTIHRDIEDLCKAGIPIVTVPGQNGGISIMEGYKIDRTLLTSQDMQAILAGLGSLDSVSGTNRVAQLMEKLSAGASALVPGGQNILIDLSSWYKDALAPKIEQIRTAMDLHQMLSFHYYAPKGESCRMIEPYYLIFRWGSWYVWGYCQSRQDYRLFKLNRMEHLAAGERFQPRFAPFPDLSNERIFPGGIQVKVLFDAGCKWRLIEEFGNQCFQEQPDGRLLFHADYTDEENLISWLLTFGEKAVLLEPKPLREKLVCSLKQMIAQYEK